MKRKIVILILIWVLFILQSTVFKFLQIADTSPNMLLILTVAIGFMQGKKEGLFTGFFCGLLIDLFMELSLAFMPFFICTSVMAAVIFVIFILMKILRFHFAW